MAILSTEFEATAGGMVLTNAILLYRSESQRGRAPRPGEEAFASLHAIEDEAGKPTIAAGEPLSRAQLRQWTEALGRNAAPEILPDNVLVYHPDMLAWWIPAQTRRTFFDLARPLEGLKVLGQRTSVEVPFPAHVFIATPRGLGVYALPESKRPDAETPALFSPVLNVFFEGSLCWGNIRKPKALNVAAIAEYERAVFDSWSTHPNPGQELVVTGKGGLVRLWDDLAARKATRFPVKRLKRFDTSIRTKSATPRPMTVGQLIAKGVSA
ncbi:PRTRC system protein B [Novosphingobium sp. ST904]|uniref:PRTRC system protein B n=1 Tax=Novosphingobium sp. ST904 TaxID=1684385 RepID=UPI0006C86EF3|nr:PRTRC system protein B [Novosphingobium sp. ST904]KPH60378.1 PRTRC system protein B [Novosphingobium sp. ST904]TCM40070.1 PRTRC genetic system protein B [Novosphingobium sp. ST904]